MQNMLRMIGYGENLGTGFPTMVDTWERMFHTTPQLTDDLQINFTELTFSGMHFGDDPSQKSSEKSREKIIQLMKETRSITQEQLAEALQLSVKTIEKHIKNLRKQGIIRRIGPDKGGHWEIVD